MYNIIKVPMRVVDDIEEIPRIYNDYSTGDIFMYDPDNGFHEKLLDYGLILHLEKDECEYYSDVPILKFDGKEYLQYEKIDVSNVDINVLNNLAVLGQIKKVVKTKERTFYSIFKDFEDVFDGFSIFKKKVKELLNITIQHHNNIATKEQEDAIREALNGN